ncbi:MAG: DUF192 domain-containing protein [Endomicrobiia bacterium]|nr:DUF192 domain-containing protein [Endomicrobiia bacterium]
MTKNKVVAARSDIADGFFSRLRGLMFAKSIAADEALVIKPCLAIHTFFMRFPLDAAFVGRGGVVLKVALGIKPWRVPSGVSSSEMVIEMASGALRKDILAEGDVIEIR